MIFLVLLDLRLGCYHEPPCKALTIQVRENGWRETGQWVKCLLCRYQDLCLDVHHLHKRQTLQSLYVASTLEGEGKRWVCYRVSSLGSSESTGFDDISCLKNNAKAVSIVTLTTGLV